MTSSTPGGRVHALIDELDAAGTLPAACRSALEITPRERFIPARMWVQEDDGGPYVALDRVVEADRWMGNVYSDRVIVTQWDDGRTEWPAVGSRPTCSASMPSVVVGMLAELDVQPGQRIREIGTGTGFNAALLAAMVGKEGFVSTIEVDAVLAGLARANLASGDGDGYGNVSVEVGDGATDRPDAGQSWDRVIATAGVHVGRLPYGWVRDTQAGGIVLAPMRADLASGPLVRFVVGDDGTATGHAVTMRVGFMELRADRVTSSAGMDAAWDDTTADVTGTTLSPWKPLLDLDHCWPLAVALPGCRYDVWEKTPERPGVAWLRDPLTASWASVAREDAAYVVRQQGPRRLWNEAETAYRWWQSRGEPPLESWVWTVAPDRQSVTLPMNLDNRCDVREE
ncbi:MAG: pcm2 [Amycolatopsis sp.]|uniref:protein-L-isoaspartate(D-aspartate) O-methyltransferase n=1 Tax=Amycolatopsis sp. TaxID=37632 RepID=UPI00260200B4|nr:protein-L-isoaspartate(D-aspartate) O-methyltransferase [Amycolatopsis sp.]MCU1682471.1 pcm2 [Amycolatopsis sp.]